MFIIRFLFVAIFLLFVLGFLGIVLFFHSLGALKRQIDRMWSERKGSSDYDYRNTGNQNGNYSTDREQTVSDNRSSVNRNKQIFSDTEGEYVDFEETP